MNKDRLRVGDVADLDVEVTYELTAEALGNVGVTVLATPVLVQYLELVAIRALEPYMDDSEFSVGAQIDVRHTAATPVGGHVHLEAKVTGIEGRKVTFVVTATDDEESIGGADHVRYVVDRTRFLEGVGAKRDRLSQ